MQTIEAVGFAVGGIDLVEAHTHFAPTRCAVGQTIGTEALTACTTRIDLCAELLAAGTAHGAVITNQGLCTFGFLFGVPRFRKYVIHAQMATTLPYTTRHTVCLAAMTDGITADGAGAQMVGAGALATRPTHGAAGITATLLTNGARFNATIGTEDI